MKRQWKEIAVVLALMSILSIPLWRPLFHAGLFDSHDSLSNLVRSSALYHSLSEKFGYVRWFKDFSFGHGYPFLNFYAPLTYYITSFFHLLGFTFTASVKLLIIGQTLLRGFSMYLLAKQIFGKFESFLSGIAFIYAPYFICDIYVRGDFSESLCFSILPLAVLFFRSLIITGKIKYVAYASITYSLLILSHNCLTIPFSGIILAQILFLGFQKKSNILKAFLAFILGIALSTIFWLPALMEMKYVHLARVTEGRFFYANNFRGLRELLSSRWGFGRSARDPMPVGIGWLHIFAFFSSIYLIRKAESRRRLTIAFFIFLSIAGTFLITPFSKKIWEVIPLIKFLQFPWRLLSVIAFGTSFLFGSFGLISGKKKYFFCGIILIVTIAFYGRYARPYRYIGTTDIDLEPCKISCRDTKTAYSDEYLPIWVIEKPSKKDECVVISKGKGVISGLRRQGSDYDFSISARGDTEIMLDSYWYPGWRVWVDDREIPIAINEFDGRICFSVPPGEHRILVRFLDTRLRMTAKMISLLSLITVIIIIFLSRAPGRSRLLKQSLTSSILVFLLCGEVFSFPLNIPDPCVQRTGNVLYVERDIGHFSMVTAIKGEGRKNFFIISREEIKQLGLFLLNGDRNGEYIVRSGSEKIKVNLSANQKKVISVNLKKAFPNVNYFYEISIKMPDEGKLDIKFIADRYAAALACLENGQYSLAQLILEELLEKNPEWIEARLYLGVVYERSGLPREAVKTFKEAMSSYSSLFKAYRTLGKGFAAGEDRKTFEDLFYKLTGTSVDKVSAKYRLCLIPWILHLRTGIYVEGGALFRAGEDDPGELLYGPYMRFPAGAYRVEYTISSPGSPCNGPVVTIDVLDWPKKIAERNINGNELSSTPRKFSISFFNEDPLAELEFRISPNGKANILAGDIHISCDVQESLKRNNLVIEKSISNTFRAKK